MAYGHLKLTQYYHIQNCPVFAIFPLFVLLDVRLSQINYHLETSNQILNYFENRYTDEFKMVLKKSVDFGKISIEEDKYMRENYGASYLKGCYLTVLDITAQNNKEINDIPLKWTNVSKNPISDIIQMEEFTRYYCSDTMTAFFKDQWSIMTCNYDNSYFEFKGELAKQLRPLFSGEMLSLEENLVNLRFIPPVFRNFDMVSG